MTPATDDLVFRTAMELAQAIQRREASAVEVLDAHLAQIARPALCLNGTRDELCQQELMQAVVEKLPPTQRTALVLKFQEDMKIDDIAAAMGKTPGAVKLLIHRGVTKLRETSLEWAE